MEASLAEPTVSGQARKKASRPSLRWLGVLAVLGGLTVLAFAEAVWLEEGLPRDYVARTSLIVVPQALGAGSDAWADTMLNLASQDEVLLSVVRKLNPRNDSTGALLSPAQLQQRMRFNAQCVQVPDGDGVLMHGALLSVTVRGVDGEEVAAIADAWEETFVQAIPSLAAKPLRGLAVPHLPCEGR